MMPLRRGSAAVLAFVVLVSGCTAPSVNHPPSIKSWEPKGDTQVAEESTTVFRLNASDPDGQKLKCSWYLDGVLNSTSTAPFLFIYGPGRKAGNHAIQAVVSDGSLTVARIWKVAVYKVNHPPVVSVLLPSGREPPVNEGGALEFRAVVSDPDGDMVNLTWLLDGRTVGQGSANYTFSPGFEMAGAHDVRLNASDGRASTEEAWNVTVVNVNRAPRMVNDTPAGEPRLAEMSTVGFHAEAVDDDGDRVSLSWSLDGLDEAKGQDYYYTPDYQSEGMHEVRVTASDGTLEVRRVWNVTVDNLNRPPELVFSAPEGDPAITEWDPVRFGVEGQDPDEDMLQVSWFLDNATAPVSIGPVFNYTAGFRSAGNHTVRTVLSDGNASVTRSWNVSVRRAVSNWTVLAFMNADNDLEPYLIEDFNEMEAAGSTPSVNIVVQMDRHPSYDASNGDWKGARRYRVEKDDDSALLGSRFLEDLGEVDMGAEATLRDFLLWGWENFPSEHCMLVMSGHGDGWTGISQDFTDQNHRLSVGSVTASMGAFVAARGAPVDVLELDVCYWAMLETDWSLRQLAHYIVASEEIDPSPGQSWAPVLRDLDARPDMAARELAVKAVSYFSAGYSEALSSPEDNETFTQSAVDTSMLAPIAESLGGLCDILEGNLSAHLSGITAARQAVRSFGKPEYVDLHDFARLLRQNSASDALNASADAVMDAVVRAVVSEAHGKNRQGASGISIYFPAYSYAYKQSYGELDLSLENMWCPLLLAYYNTTGRGAGEAPAPAASGGPCPDSFGRTLMAMPSCPDYPGRAMSTGPSGRSKAGETFDLDIDAKDRVLIW
jgi:hypothetical protein